jgi:hypothetical protein
MFLFYHANRIDVSIRNEIYGNWELVKSFNLRTKKTQKCKYKFLWFFEYEKNINSWTKNFESVKEMRAIAVKFAKSLSGDVKVEELCIGVNAEVVPVTIWKNGQWFDLPVFTNSGLE